MSEFSTVYPVKLEVKKDPTKKSGYTIYHNQKIGWAGTIKEHFAWYKDKKFAQTRADELMDCYNKKLKV